MAKYNFFISYHHSDGIEIASRITNALTEKGYTVWLDSGISVSENFVQSITTAISNCDCFIPIITQNYINSHWTITELNYALKVSGNRSTAVFPIICDAEIQNSDSLFMMDSANYKSIDSTEGINKIVDAIDNSFGAQFKKELLYEKLSEYSKLNAKDKEAQTVCEIIESIFKYQSDGLFKSQEKTEETFKELLRLYSILEKYYGKYDKESKDTAKLIISTLKKVEDFLENNKTIFTQDLFLSSVAVRILYTTRDIRNECIDILSNGDVRNEESYLVMPYYKIQLVYIQSFNNLYDISKGTLNAENKYSKEDILFIKETEKFFLYKTYSPTTIVTAKTDSTKSEEKSSKEDEILQSIAEFIQKGNKLFDILQKQSSAGDFLKCLLTSYERLKNYCEVIGEKKIASECVDRIVELRNEIDKSDENAPSGEKRENGIKSLLGFTLNTGANYDVFISFKSADADMAEKIYKYLQRHLKVPFWSKRTLPQLSQSEYEDAIYDAIRKSKHFVVVLSNLDYLNGNWVKREMAAFDRAITEGRKKDSNFVFVVTDDVYSKIINSNKMCLDERYCGYQIIKMSEYEETLYQYIK